MKRIRDMLPKRDRTEPSDGKPKQNNIEPEDKPNSSKDQDQVSQGSEGETLFDAVQRGAADEVEELLSQDVPIDCRDEKERTPLIVAAFEGKLDLVNRLIELDADIDAVDTYGETPLIAATYGGHLDVVKFLVSKGANLEIRNNEGLTALEMAQETGANAVTSYLAAQVAGSASVDDTEKPTDPEYEGASPSAPASPMIAGATPNQPEPEPYNAGHDGIASATPSSSAAQATASATSLTPEQDAVADEISAALSPPREILEANEEKIEYDAWDHKMVRSINEKTEKVLNKAGLELGDHTGDTVFKGSYMAVLKPRSQEYKRFRKLWKHPDLLIDPRRWRDWTGASAVRKYCLAEGIDVSPLSGSHFIELYYVKDLRLILTLAEEASTNNYTVRQLKRAIESLREEKDDSDPGKVIIKTLDQSLPLLEEPDLVELCADKDRVLEELSRAERKKIRSLIKKRKPSLDEWKGLMDTLEGILSDLEDE